MKRLLLYTPVPTTPATYTEITSPTYTSPEIIPAAEKTSGREIPSKEIIKLNDNYNFKYFNCISSVFLRKKN